MTTNQPSESLLFNAARQIENRDERARYLADACGDDTGLRERVEKLLVALDAESQFLEQPAEGLQPTVVLADHHPSVLRQLGNTLDEVPRISLVEPSSADADPVLKPASPEIPKSQPDSRYRLDGEIARGGMGAVLKGRDTDLGRDLAIKVLLDAHRNNPQVIQRFIEEAQIGGQLQHPGIAPVYELGRFADDRPFFSMKLVKGETLSKLLSQRKDSSHDRARFLGIFEQVCQTVAYAHSRNVIHRDLKPANIMVGAFGEVQVMDWGLAKVLASGGIADERKARDSQQTQSIVQTMRSLGSDAPASFGSVGSAGSETQMGSVMGTPAYMPPEQALGEIDQLDQRSDVFGLGAILAEILTGQPPYVGEDGTQVFRMASRGKLDDCFARLDTCGADAELVQLTKDCLELEPADRPGHAGVVAERISRYQESVETKLRETEIQRAAEAARVIEQKKRFRVILALAAMIGLFLLSGGTFAWWRNEQLQAAALREVRNNDAISELLSRCRAALVAGDIQTATTALEDAKQRFDDGGAERHTATLQSLEADLVLLKDLTNVDTFRWTPRTGISLGSTRRSSSFPDAAKVAERIHTAFVQFGMDLSSTPTEQLHERILESSVGERLIAALNLLILFDQSEPASRLLKDIDSHSFRNSIRDALMTNDTQQINSLIGTPEALEQPASFIAVLAQCELISNEDRLRLSKRALGRDPDDLPLLMNLTGLLSVVDFQELDDKKERLRWCQALLAAAPRYHLAHERLGEALSEIGEIEDAVTSYERSLELNPDNPDCYSSIGSTLWGKDPARAIGYYRKAIEIEPTDPFKLLNIGQLLVNEGNQEEGMQCLYKSVELSHDTHAYLLHFILAREQSSMGDIESAIDNYRISIQLYPEFDEAHYELGILLSNQGEHDEAMDCYRKAIELNPRYKQAFVNLGSILCDIKHDYEGAASCFRSALEIDPSFAIAYLNLGMAMYGSGDKSGALRSFRKAVDLQPDDRVYFDNLVSFLCSEEKWEDLARTYKVALERVPTNASLHNEASWYLASVKADAPKHPYAAQAAEWGRRATELAPEEGNHWNTYGYALLRNQQSSEAIDALNKSIELSGGSAYDYLFLAIAHGQKQEKTVARDWFDKALAWKAEHQAELEEDSQLQKFYMEAEQLLQPETKDQPAESVNSDSTDK